MQNEFIKSFGKYLFHVLSEIKVIFWKFIKDRDSVTKIRVFKDYSFKFKNFGDIAEILYAREHLVPYNKGFENNVLESFVNLIKPKSVILDIGANIGLFSLIGAKKLNSDVKIIAFEPAKSTFITLNKNIELNNFKDVIQTEQLALSNINGKGVLSSPDNIKEQYLSGDAFNFVKSSDVDSIDSIIMKRLDDYLSENDIFRVDFIKIDVEGAELMCFMGADKLLSSEHKPIILFECVESTCERFGYNKIDLLMYLTNRNYLVKELELNQYIATPKY